MPSDSRYGSEGPEWLPPDRDHEPRAPGDPGPAQDSDSLPPGERRTWAPLDGQETYEQLYRTRAKRYSRRLWLHLALFAATILSTAYVWSPLYSACVMAILTAHEFGHYYAARYYMVPATLPYFIPAPFFFFGTMGAVIRMSPFIPNRRALFDIAAAGPLAGMVLAVPISFVGMMMSERVPIQEDASGLMLGDPLLFQAFERLLFGAAPEGTVLMINDVALAGWVGLFVTALNLLPIGQLDGGHVSYAVFGRRSRSLAWATFATLGAVCLVFSVQYLVLLVLLFFMGIRHPPTLQDSLPLGSARRRVALLLLGVFVLCFTPVPITVSY